MITVLDLPFVAGALLSWSLAAPPGPVNALIAHAAARRGFLAGWMYGLGAIAGDLTMLALTWFGVLRLAEAFPWLKVAFALAGAALMGWFAVGAWRTARRQAAGLGGDDDDDRPMGRAREFGKAYVLVTTSPFNWAWWLTAGSSMMTLLGWVTLAGFFAGLLLWTILWAALAAAGGTRVKRLAEFVSYGAAGVLALFAGIMLWYGVREALLLVG